MTATDLLQRCESQEDERSSKVKKIPLFFLFFLPLAVLYMAPLLPSLLVLFCTVNLFVKKKKPPCRDHGQLRFCFATVWLRRIHT